MWREGCRISSEGRNWWENRISCGFRANLYSIARGSARGVYARQGRQVFTRFGANNQVNSYIRKLNDKGIYYANKVLKSECLSLHSLIHKITRGSYKPMGFPRSRACDHLWSFLESDSGFHFFSSVLRPRSLHCDKPPGEPDVGVCWTRQRNTDLLVLSLTRGLIWRI